MSILKNILYYTIMTPVKLSVWTVNFLTWFINTAVILFLILAVCMLIF